MANDPHNKAELGEILASEIFDKIQEGDPVEYDHVIIKGELDLSKLDLPKEHVARTEYQIKTLMLPEESRVVSSPIKITNSQFDAELNFGNNLFRGPVYFNNTTTVGWKNVDFKGATFNEGADFRKATFRGCADFRGATFNENYVFSWTKKQGTDDEKLKVFLTKRYHIDWTYTAGFVKSEDGKTINISNEDITISLALNNDESEVILKIDNIETDTFIVKKENGELNIYNGNNANFNQATFRWKALFSGAAFRSRPDFWETKFHGEAYFNGATFSDIAYFSGAKFEGDVLTFKDAIFASAVSQEDACRRAKNVLEKNGNREEAGYHFYREMEAKRKQKSWIYRYPEFVFIQLIFGYGVHPWRLIFWWLIIIIIFASMYDSGNVIAGASKWFEYLKFSFATAIAPGYIATILNSNSTGYKLTAGYQAIAIGETIVGTFLWAGFIATFAKKYMR